MFFLPDQNTSVKLFVDTNYAPNEGIKPHDLQSEYIVDFATLKLLSF